MYLDDLYESVSLFEDAALIGREFSYGGCEYAVLGFVNFGEVTSLVFLEYNSRSYEESCDEESDNLTNREQILADQNAALTLPDLLQEIVVGGKRLEFDTILWQGSIDELDAGDVYLISKFFEKGRRSEKFFSYPPEKVSLYQATLFEKQENLSALDLSEIRLAYGRNSKYDYPQLKLNLESDKDLNIKIPLFGGENELCIKRLNLVSYSELEMADDELCKNLVPGKSVAVIEYTCDCELGGLCIATTPFLDAQYGRGYGCMVVENGCFFVHFDYGEKSERGNDSKFYTIQEAVPADAKTLECELICCSKEIETPYKEILL